MRLGIKLRSSDEFKHIKQMLSFGLYFLRRTNLTGGFRQIRTYLLHSMYYFAALGTPIFKMPALLGLHHLGATTRWCKLRLFTSAGPSRQINSYLPQPSRQIRYYLPKPSQQITPSYFLWVIHVIKYQNVSHPDFIDYDQLRSTSFQVD